MRTAKCCMEQGVYDHFGCDLSDLESIVDPGCPEKSKNPVITFRYRTILSVKGGLGGVSPPRAQAKPSESEREKKRFQLKTQHGPLSTWWAHTSINETRTSISQDVSGVAHGPSIYIHSISD